MVKMISSSNSKTQQFLKLNEYCLVANRIWKAGRNSRNRKLRSKLLNPNDGNETPAPPPPPSSGDLVSSKGSVGLTMVSGSTSQIEASISPQKGMLAKESERWSKSSMSLTVFGIPTR
jgi:hypothetical protein